MLLLNAYLNGSWHEYIAQHFGYPRYENVTILGNLSVAVPLSFMLFLALYWVTVKGIAREQSFVEGHLHRRLQMMTNPALYTGAFAFVLCLSFSSVSRLATRQPLEWVELGYSLVAGVIVSFSAYWLIDIPLCDTAGFRTAKAEAKRETLKLEAEFLRELVQLLTWAAILIFTAVVGYMVFQMFLVLPKESFSIFWVQLQFVNLLLVVLYFAIGTWFGVIAQLFRRYGRIVLSMLET